jgi:hypothetical protein
VDFSRVFSDILAKRGISQAGFARLVGMTGPFVNMVIRRKATPPPDRIEGWADALGLVGDERAVFLDLAAMEHLPADVRPRFLAIYQRSQASDATIQALEARLADLEARFQTLSK